MDIILTRQTPNVNSLADYMNSYRDESLSFNAARGVNRGQSTNRLKRQQQITRNYLQQIQHGEQQQLSSLLSVEIEYTQISTYKTIDPVFNNSTYVIEEPFSTAVTRREYRSYLQSLSLNFDNVTLVSPVSLPLPKKHGNDEDGSSSASNDGDAPEDELNVGIYVAIGVSLFIVLQIAFIYCRKKRQNRPEYQGGRGGDGGSKDSSSSSRSSRSRARQLRTPRTSNISRHEYEEGEGSYSYKTPPRLTGSISTRESTIDVSSSGAATSNCTEVIMDIIIPHGRVGCIIDSSPHRGPYICEIDENSPLKGELQFGDRILDVNGEDVQRMSAIDVSRLLGRENAKKEERRITILREFFYDLYVSETVEGDDDESSGNAESVDDEEYANEEFNADEESR